MTPAFGPGTTPDIRYLPFLYPTTHYTWVVEQLDAITAQAGLATHADALTWLLQRHTHRDTP